MAGSRTEAEEFLSRRIEEMTDDERGWYELGLNETSEEFLAGHALALASPDSVRIMTNSDGSPDIVVLLDPRWGSDRAAEAAQELQARIYGHVARILLGRRA